MQIIVAKKAGFCFGVKRAIDITFKLAKEGEKGVYTYGPLIHNPQVVAELKRKGINTINDLSSSEIETLIIRTHGVAPETYAESSIMSYKLIDATCPFVKKAQKYTKQLKDEGYEVLIVGDRSHPEVQGLIGYAGDDVKVANNIENIPPLKKKVGIIVQTTQAFETFKNIVSEVLRSAREVKIYNTICDSTTQRVRETKELAQKADVMIIVGGKNSSNTNQLVRLSKSFCDKVYHVETAEEIMNEWFDGAETAGITGGASTPQWIIDDVVNKIREISVRR
jgi:4-hydroxy-3-methylbut-2-enyl diphosphate reductase